MSAPVMTPTQSVQSGAPPVASSTSRQRLSRQVTADIVAITDATAVVLGALLPSWIYHTYGHLEINWITIVQSSLFAALVAFLWLRKNGMYDTARLHDLPQDPGQLFAALALSIALVIGLAMPLAAMGWHIVVWYAAWISASFTVILATRGVSHAVLTRMTAAGRFDRSVAVFGAGVVSRRVHDRLHATEAGIHFAGVYDDREADDRINTEGLALAGRLEDLLAATYDGRIDDIIIALPQGAEARIAGIVRKLEHAPCNVHIVTHVASDLVPASGALRVSQIGEVGLLDVKDKPLADWAPITKRAEDLLVASLGLLLTLPIILVAIIAIKWETSGPAFYSQRRRGLNRKVIEIHKLRTLKTNDGDSDVRQVTVGDSRVTRVGRILRRTSIDELPQLWNVLKGEMSIVGPRPHALIHDDQFSSLIEDYANRHQVKPGITGLAQVKGFRGETRTVEVIKGRVEQDIAYVKSWSLWLDIKIIARTLVILAKGTNAH